MDVHTVLAQSRQAVLDEAVHTLRTSHFSHFSHYESGSDRATRDLLDDLYHHVVISVRDRDLAHIIRHSEDVAHERFSAGFDIVEVQTAFNTLEQSMWRRVVSTAPLPEVAERVGLLSAVLGAGKDAVARTYVSLATHRHCPTLDVAALAQGTI